MTARAITSPALRASRCRPSDVIKAWQRALSGSWLRQCALGVCLVLLSSACARLGDISGPTPIGGVVNSVSINTPDVTLNVGSTAALQVAARDADGQEIRDRTVTWSSSDANVVNVSSTGVLTALATGVAQVSASIAGRSATAQVTVVQRPVSSLEIGPLAPRILVGGFIQLVALPRDDTGAELQNRPVFWSSSDAAIANVDAAGFVTGVSPGAATITAISETREAAIGVTVAAVPVVSVIVSPRVDTIVVGQSTQLNALGLDSLTVPLTDRTVLWTSASTSVATVSASGLVIGVTPGTVRVDAIIEGVTGSATLVVQPRPIGGVVISPGQSTLTVGQTAQLSAQITDANGNLLTGRSVTYTSDNPAVAEVSVEGELRALSPGVTTIRAISEGRAGEMRVTVLPTPVASVRITPAQTTLSVGGSVALAAAALDAAGNVLPERAVTWSSGAPSVLSVNSTGRVVALAPGTGLVFASIDGRLASATITVRSTDVGGIQVTPSIATIIIGTSADFVAVARDANNNPLERPITWSISNASVAVVSSAGRVRALSLGIATVTATVDGRSASAVITVVPVPVASVTVALASTVLTVGQTTQATATLRDAQSNVLTGRPLAWSTSDASVATVSGTGLVTAIGGGAVVITATSGAASGSASANVSQQAGSIEVQRQAGGAVSGVAFVTQPVVRILDLQGNVVTTGSGASAVVTATRASGIATLSGTVTATAVNGVATFTNLGFSGLGVGAHTIRFTSNNPQLTVVSAVVNVAAGSAASVVANSSVSQSARVATAVSEPPSVRAVDAGGNAVSGVNVTFTVLSGGGSISPASPATVTTAANGVAAITSWTLGVTPGTNAVRAVSTGLSGSPVTFSATATIGSPVQLAITRQPAGATSGVVLGTQPVVEIRDAVGNRVVGATSAVTATVATGNGELVGTRTVNAVNGVATFANLQVNGSGGHTLRFSVTGLTSAVSGNLVVTQVASSLALRQQPSGARSGIALVTQPVVEIRDNAGLVVVSGAGASLAIAAEVASGGGALSGTATVTAVNGVASFNNLTLTGAGTQRLRFRSTAPALSVVSDDVVIAAGTPANITATSALSQSGTVGTAVSAAPSVRITDASGNNVSGVNVTFTVTAGGGVIVPASVATVATNAQGVAALTSWTLGAAPGANTVTAAATGLTGSPITFSATGTVGAATQIVIVTQPSGAVSGVSLSTQPVVELRDAQNNRVTSANGTITAAVASGSGSVAGTLTATAVNGVATFTNLRLNGVGVHTLRFSGSGLAAATSEPLTVTQVAASLQIQTQPSGAASGSAFATQPIVRILDNANLLIASGSASELSVTATRESGSGVLSGTATINAVGGVATFSNLTLTGSGPHTLRFATTTPSLSVVSASIVVGAGAPARINAVSPVNQSATTGASVTAPSVEVTDAAGNPVSGVNVAFAVTAGGGTTSPSSGSVVVTGANGRATLQSWTLGTSPGVNTVTATVSGLTGSPVVFSATATVGAATQLVLVVQPAGAVSGVPFTTQPKLEVRDASNNVVSSSTVAVTVSRLSGTGTLAGTLTVNAVAGVVEFAALQINGSGNHTLSFAANGLTSATSSAISVSQVAASLAIVTQPAGAVSGAAFSTQPVVHVLDNAGLRVQTGSAATLQVTASRESGSGTLTGTTQGSAVDGVISFTDLTLTGSGAHTLRFASGSPALSVISSSFTLGAGAPVTIAAVSATEQSALAGAQVAAPSVLVTDATGNPVSGVNVSFTVTAGGGTTSPASGSTVATGADGRASLTSWTLGASAGTNTVTATADGLSGSPVVFNATATAQPATQLAIVTQPGGAVSGVPFTTQPVIQVRNANGDVVTTATDAVTVSITSGTGALAGTQTVNAVNGVATFTNLQLNGSGDHQLRFATTSPALSVVSGTFTVQAAPPTTIAAQSNTAPSAPVATAVPEAPSVLVTNAAGDPVAGVDVTFAVTAGGGTTSPSSGSVVATNALGIASLTSWTLGAAAGTNTVTATAAGLSGSPVTFNATGTAVAQPATQLAIVTQPSGAVSGVPFATQPVIEVRDANGDRVITAADAITVSKTSPSGTLVGTQTVSAVNGVATFTNLQLNGLGDHQLRFTSGVLTEVISNTLAVTQVAASLAVVTQPAGAVSGAAFSTQPVVHVLDNAGVRVQTGSAATLQVTASRETGSGTLTGTTQLSAVDGVIAFTDLALSGSGAHTVRFSTTSPALSVISGSLNVGAAPATTIISNSNTSQAAPVSTAVAEAPSVLVTNAADDPVGGVAVTFTVTAGGGSTSPTSGSVVTTNASGIAALTSWTLGAAAGTNTVIATAAGLSGSPVTFNATATAVILPATQLAIDAQPTGAVSGVTFAAPVVVQIRNANGDVVTASTAQVTAAIATGGGSGALVGTVQVAAVNGVATFSNLRINGSGSHTLQFESAGLASAVSASIAVTQTAASLVLVTQPTTAVSGTAFSPQPVVEIRDNAGLRITSGPDATRSVTVARSSGNATLAGANTAAAVAGLATFTDLSFTDFGTGSHTLDFTIESLGLTTTSSAITVSAGVATTLSAISALTQSATVSTSVTAPPSVRATDASGNPVAGVKVVFTVSSGDGVLSPASGDTMLTNAAGVATVGSWTLGAAEGDYTVTAVAAGLSGSPLTFTATGIPAETPNVAWGAPLRALSDSLLPAPSRHVLYTLSRTIAHAPQRTYPHPVAATRFQRPSLYPDRVTTDAEQ